MKIYQSFLGNDQRAHISSSAVPYDVMSNTRPDQREYELFKTLHADTGPEGEPWGVVSWKFQHKSLVSVEEFANFAERMFDRGCDCAFINPMIGNEAVFVNVWEQGHVTHGNMNKLCELLRLITVAPVSSPMGRRHFAFCNYFVANQRFWRSYFSFCDYVLERLQAEADRGSEVGALYSGAANYARDRSLSMRPFIIERLFSSFISIASPLKIVGFRHAIGHYQRKFGERLGTFLHELSALKNRGIDLKDKQILTQWQELRTGLLRATAMKGLIFHLDDPDAILLSPQYHHFLSPETGPNLSIRGRAR